MDEQPYQLGIIAGTVPLDLAKCKVEEIPNSAVTPFGMASECFRRVTFSNGHTAILLGRHGFAHKENPSAINYRANIWGMRALGVTHLLSISACGSLQPDIFPGRTLVIPIQLFDFTKGIRKHTFFEEIAVHVAMADPICLNFANELYETVVRSSHSFIKLGGTCVVIEGPQFSTRAESIYFQEVIKAATVGMTPLPEAKLAREACLCYAVLQLPCDYDAWIENGKGANGDDIHKKFAEFDMISIMRTIAELASFLPDRTCDCPRSLEGFAVHTDIKALREEQFYAQEFFSRWAELGLKIE